MNDDETGQGDARNPSRSKLAEIVRGVVYRSTARTRVCSTSRDTSKSTTPSETSIQSPKTRDSLFHASLFIAFCFKSFVLFFYLHYFSIKIISKVKKNIFFLIKISSKFTSDLTWPFVLLLEATTVRAMVGLLNDHTRERHLTKIKLTEKIFRWKHFHDFENIEKHTLPVGHDKVVNVVNCNRLEVDRDKKKALKQSRKL